MGAANGDNCDTGKFQMFAGRCRLVHTEIIRIAAALAAEVAG
jgi:hypothetical protein